MKYLKKFFESDKSYITLEEFNEIKSYLNDVFLELEDDGYEISIHQHYLYNYEYIYGISLSITKHSMSSHRRVSYDNGVSFDSSDVINPIEHSVSYLSEFGLKLDKTSVYYTKDDQEDDPDIFKINVEKIEDLKKPYFYSDELSYKNCRIIRLYFKL